MTPSLPGALLIRPTLRTGQISIREARAFIFAAHRHHPRLVGAWVAFGCWAEDKLVGVATVGRPVSRVLAGKGEGEVTRVCTDGTPNACSALYGACIRWWRSSCEGPRLITYTQQGETGASLRAVGASVDACLPARRGWQSREGRAEVAPVPRFRWVLSVRP